MCFYEKFDVQRWADGKLSVQRPGRNSSVGTLMPRCVIWSKGRYNISTRLATFPSRVRQATMFPSLVLLSPGTSGQVWSIPLPIFSKSFINSNTINSKNDPLEMKINDLIIRWEFKPISLQHAVKTNRIFLGGYIKININPKLPLRVINAF